MGCPWLWILEVISSPQAEMSCLPGIKVGFPVHASLRSKHMNLLTLYRFLGPTPFIMRSHILTFCVHMAVKAQDVPPTHTHFALTETDFLGQKVMS